MPTLKGMLPQSVIDYFNDLAYGFNQLQEPDLKWEAELRAQNELPLRARLAQLFTIPPKTPPIMVPPAAPSQAVMPRFNTFYRPEEGSYGADQSANPAFRRGMLPRGY